MCDPKFYNWSASLVINTPGHIVSFTSFGKGGRRSTPGEPLIFFSACNPDAHTHTHSSLPLPSSFAPVALARNTAPCFSWQNSEGRPCVPEGTSQRAHFSHFLRRALALASPRPPHVVQAAEQRGTGQDGRVRSFSLCLSHSLACNCTSTSCPSLLLSCLQRP